SPAEAPVATATAAAAKPLPEFDPLARPARREPVATRTTRKQAAAAPASTPTAGQPGSDKGKRPSFHALRERASGQLRAFLAPARDSIDGDVITLDYPEHAAFHHRQLNQRMDELTVLVAEVFGDDFRLVVNGPGGTAPAKKA